MARTSLVHYISPSAISIIPNCNGSADDIAVQVAAGTKIRVYSRAAEALGMANATYREWTLKGRNRRLLPEGNATRWTIFARLAKDNPGDGYIVFTPITEETEDGKTVGRDKYWHVTSEGFSRYEDDRPDEDFDPDDPPLTGDDKETQKSYWFFRIGWVSKPGAGNLRTVYLDTGILGTDEGDETNTEEMMKRKYVTIDWFRRVFTIHGTGRKRKIEKYDEQGDPVYEIDPETGEYVWEGDGERCDILPNDMDHEITDTESMFGTWTEQWLSALGIGSGSGGSGGGGGGDALDEPLLSINQMVATPTTAGQTLVWKGIGLGINGSGWDFDTAGMSQQEIQTLFDSRYLKLTSQSPQSVTSDITLNGLLTINHAQGFDPTSDQVGNNVVLTKGETLTLLDGRYVTVAFWNSLFETYNGNSQVNVNTENPIINNLKILVGTWTESYVSALGIGSGGSGGGGVWYLSQLEDVDHNSTPSNGDALVWDGQQWTFDTAGLNENELGQYLSTNKYIKADSNTKWWGRTMNNGVVTGNIDMTLGDSIGWSLTGTSSPLSMVTLKTESSDRLFILGEGTTVNNNRIPTYLRGSSIYFQTVSGNIDASLTKPASGDAIFYVKKLQIGSIVISEDTTNHAIHVEQNGIYADTYVSALGTGSGGGGGTPLNTLLMSLNDADVANPTSVSNQVLVCNNGQWRWEDYGGGSVTNLTTLTVKGGTTNAVVYNPADTQAATLTVSGQKVNNTDVLTVTADGTAHTLTIALADNYGDTKNPYAAKPATWVLAGPVSGNDAAPAFRALQATDIPSLSWNKITTDKPTTISGYGITDAKIESGVITLGSVTITPLTDATLRANYKWWGASIDASGNREGNLSNVGHITPKTSQQPLYNIGASDNRFGTLYASFGSFYGTAPAVYVGSDDSNRIALHWKTESSKSYRGLYDGGGWLIGYDGTSTFLNKGNVGIGTTSPYTKLHVDGGVKATKFYFLKPNANNDTGAVYLEYVNGQSGVHLCGAGFYADTYVSALGTGSGGSGGINMSDVWSELSGHTNDNQISIYHLSQTLATWKSSQFGALAVKDKATFADISSIVLTNVSDGDVLKFDANTGKWVNGTGGGFEMKSVTNATLKGLSGTFGFYGQNLPDNDTRNYDWVGIQVGTTNDKWQLMADSGHLMVRQNDAGGSSSTGWVPVSSVESSGWYTVLDTGNYSSYVLPKTGGQLSGALTITSGGLTLANGNVSVAGNVTANKFTLNGGTSSQFIKADGSVDSNVYIQHKEVGQDGLVGYSGSFFFGGSGTLASGEDYVGFQAGNNSDRWQMAYLQGNIKWRENDTAGSPTTGWTEWRTVVDSNNISSYLSGYDTKNTAGITQSTSKLYLVGSPSTAPDAGTYSVTNTNANLYIDADGILHAPKFETGKVTNNEIGYSYRLGTGASGSGGLAMCMDNTTSAPMFVWITTSKLTTLGNVNFNANTRIYGKDIIFYSVTGTAGTERMVIKEGGNVGIGESEPSYKLHVNGTGYFNSTLRINSGIEAPNGSGLLVYAPSSGWTGISSSQWGVGSTDKQGVIRSNNSNLLHFKGSTSYTILDVSNGVTLDTTQEISGAKTFTADIGCKKNNASVYVCNASGGKKVGLNTDNNRGVWDFTGSKWLIGNDGSNTFLMFGNVGIGTSSPSYKLHVNGTSYLGGNTTVNGNADVAGYLKPQYNNSYSLGDSSLRWSTVYCGSVNASSNSTFSGNVTVGSMTLSKSGNDHTIAASYKVTMSVGTLYVSASSFTGNVPYAGGSDIRKKNIIDIVDCDIDDIARAPIFDFTWKHDAGGRVFLGSSANYWQDVFPHAVTADSEGYLSQDYAGIALASAVITARKVLDHEERIKALEAENERLRNEVEQLKAA